MLFIIILNDNYCISMFNYRGKYEECEEYNKYNEEFKHGEFQFGLFGSIDFSLFIYQMSVLPTQMTVSTCCNVFYHIVNMCLY